jgi:hypothetical protein
VQSVGPYYTDIQNLYLYFPHLSSDLGENRYVRLFSFGEFPRSRRMKGLSDLGAWIKVYLRVWRNTRTFWIKSAWVNTCHVVHSLQSRFLDIFLNTAYNVRRGVMKPSWLDNRCSVMRMFTEHGQKVNRTFSCFIARGINDKCDIHVLDQGTPQSHTVWTSVIRFRTEIIKRELLFIYIQI